jgi:hypothetical protein
MDVVGNYVNFFGDNLDRKIPNEKSPERISKRESAMGTIPMKVNRTVGTHHDHAVNETDDERLYAEVTGEKEKKRNDERESKTPAQNGQPILSVSKRV